MVRVDALATEAERMMDPAERQREDESTRGFRVLRSRATSLAGARGKGVMPDHSR